MPQSKTTPSSPASSPPLCIPWTKSRQRPQASPPDTLAGQGTKSALDHAGLARKAQLRLALVSLTSAHYPPWELLAEVAAVHPKLAYPQRYFARRSGGR